MSIIMSVLNFQRKPQSVKDGDVGQQPKNIYIAKVEAEITILGKQKLAAYNYITKTRYEQNSQTVITDAKVQDRKTVN